MARVRGVYLRTPPSGPGAYTSKEAALAANPKMVVADAAFPKNRLESAKNAAFRVNSGGRGDWDREEFFGIWEYAKDIVLRLRRDGEAADDEGDRPDSEVDGSVEVLGFVRSEKVADGNAKTRQKPVDMVIGENDKPVCTLEEALREEGVETGGWVLLIGCQPNVPPGWEEVVNAPGSRKRRRTRK